MVGMLRFPIGVFFQKPLKSSGRDCGRRPPSRLPLLQSSELRGNATGSKSLDRFSLAQTIRFPPRLETKHDGSGGPAGSGCFVPLRKKSFKCRSSDRLRRGLSYFPSLERAEFDWQAGGNQQLNCFRLTEFAQGSPGFQFGDYRQDASVAVHQSSIMAIAQNAGNSQPPNFFDYRFLGRFITRSVIACGAYQVRRAQKSSGRNMRKPLLNGHDGQQSHDGQREKYNDIDAIMSMT